MPGVGTLSRWFDRAVHLIALVTLHFDLYRRVVDLEVVIEVVPHRPQDLLAFPHALLGDQYVAATGDHARPDSPDVQIVNVQHAIDVSHGRDHRRHVHAMWRAFEKDGHALPQDPPRTLKNQR